MGTVLNRLPGVRIGSILILVFLSFVADRILSVVRHPVEWQRIGNQIDATFTFARAHFVSVFYLALTRWR
jgi:hypothetical protein